MSFVLKLLLRELLYAEKTNEISSSLRVKELVKKAEGGEEGGGEGGGRYEGTKVGAS